MASIGPQLPPHLLRRTSKLHSPSPVQDGEEVSADEVGPQPGPSTSTPVGPQIPESLLIARTTQPTTEAGPSEVNEEDEEDAYVPALPPKLLANRTVPGPSSSGNVAGPSLPPHQQSRRVVGPTLPGHERITYDEDDEDEDDGYGPMPLPEGAGRQDALSEGVREFLEKEEKRRKEIEEAAKPKQLKRDEWMLVPPTSSDLLNHLSDPLKLKARQFSRGAGAAARSAPNNLWTETPAERQQRIADEVAGKKGRAANAEEGSGLSPEDERKKRKRDESLRRVVEEHNKSSRGKTLLDMHSESSGASASKKSKKSKDDGEGPPGIWDHARDMAMGGRHMDEKQRSKLIADARSLGDRFGSGKTGGYL